MRLTIDYANGAVLTLQGACFWTSSANETCTGHPSSLPCTLAVYGTFSNVANQVAFNACYDPHEANGGSTILMVSGADSPNIFSREVPCSFRHSNLFYQIKFASP
jgi:hypothetical protein